MRITPVEWAFLAVLAIIFSGPVGHLIHGALTGTKPSAAEVATAQQMAATPAHPALRHPGLPVDGRPLDEDEQDATYAPQQRGQQ